MSAIKVLLINYDAQALELYGSLLAEQGIQIHAASTMPQALDMILLDEYAGVAINANGDFDYLPLLKVMRVLTPAPIGIATTDYDEDEHEAALKNGANLYRIRHDPAKYRVRNFADMAKIYLAFDTQNQKSVRKIVCGDILLNMDTRKVFVKDREISLKPKEFDILCYFILNEGIVLSHEQILSSVWGHDYEDASRGSLWNYIYQLRRKLRMHPEQSEYIKTIRGVGYCFAVDTAVG